MINDMKADERKRLEIVRMLLEKMPQGTDIQHVVKMASILHEYIYNNQLPTTIKKL